MTDTFAIDSIVLKAGAHPAGSQEMCVMEAVAFLAGEPWSDSPRCVSPVIAAFLRSYNDSVSDEVRQSLKQYIPRLIGTRGSQELEDRRSWVAADWFVRIHTPAWLRLAGLTTQAEALESLPEITSFAQVPSGPLEAARQAGAAAWAAAGAAVWDEARAAAWAAAWAAAGAAAGAAAWAAAGAAAWAAARDAAWAAAWNAVRAAAGDALRPTVEKLQATVPALIEKMLSEE